MQDFFKKDPDNLACKGLVLIGDKALIYRRDGKTTDHPHELDLPGGGKEDEETPFQTFQREVKEEFGLFIAEEDIVYARRYPVQDEPGKFYYFPVAQLSEAQEAAIVFGDEGEEYMLMTVDDYMARRDTWSLLQDDVEDYLKTSRA